MLYLLFFFNKQISLDDVNDVNCPVKLYWKKLMNYLLDPGSVKLAIVDSIVDTCFFIVLLPLFKIKHNLNISPQC